MLGSVLGATREGGPYRDPDRAYNRVVRDLGVSRDLGNAKRW